MKGYADLVAVRVLRGRVAARRARAPLGPEGARGQAGLDLRDGRLHRRAQVAHRTSTTSGIDYEAFSDDAARRALPEGRRLAARSARAGRAACASPSSTWRSTAAASASWWTSTRAGSSSSSGRANGRRWPMRTSSTSIDQALTAAQRARQRSAACSRRPSCSRRCARRSRSSAAGITGVFCGGTEMTPQFHRFAAEELLEGAYFAPTYGNTLMGLATHRPRQRRRRLGHHLLPAVAAGDDRGGRSRTSPTAWSAYGETGRVRLTTLTQRVLHAALPGARRGRARAALRPLPVGRRPQRAAVRALRSRRWSKGSTDVRHIPILRRGAPYRSVDVATVPHYRTREAVAEVSQANGGLIARDLRRGVAGGDAARRSSLWRSRELVALTARAAEPLRKRRAAAGRRGADAGRLRPPDVGHDRPAPRDGAAQPGEDARRARRTWATCSPASRGAWTCPCSTPASSESGPPLELRPARPHAGRRAAQQLPRRARAVDADDRAQDRPRPEAGQRRSPGRPTAVIQAFLTAGAPPDAFAYYPAGHAAAARDPAPLRARDAVRGPGRDRARGRTTRASSCTGPGYCKVLLGPDAADHWERHLDVMVASIAENAGRSCVNASGIWTTAHGDAIAEALAERLAAVRPRDAEDDGRAARALRGPARGAARSRRWWTTGWASRARATSRPRTREGGRLAQHDGGTYLLPTHRALRRRPSPREPRVPVPVRVRRRGAPGRSCRACSARRSTLTAITDDPGAAPAAPGLAARAAAEPGRRAHPADQLGAAARGQPVRAPRTSDAPSSGRRR